MGFLDQFTSEAHSIFGIHGRLVLDFYHTIQNSKANENTRCGKSVLDNHGFYQSKLAFASHWTIFMVIRITAFPGVLSRLWICTLNYKWIHGYLSKEITIKQIIPF